MHLSNLYPQWGGVDPRRCYWSCITSSCMCHPTKTAPSTAYHNVATSLTPLEGVMDAPLLWRSFSLTPLQGHHFRLHGLHVRPFCREFFGKAARFSLDLLTNSFYLTIVRISTHYGRGLIFTVNKLLELEAADWQRQLEKAVGGFKVRSPVPFYFSLYGVSE